MNKSTGIIIGVVALIVAGGVYASMGNTKDLMMDDKSNDSAMMKKDDGMMAQDSEMKKDEMMKKGETAGMDKEMAKGAVMAKGSYETYSSDKVMRAQTGDVVVFFHASWCPSCRGLDSDIQANMGSIPEGVTILKADYDKETELKKKYGVTSQHTLVQVDKDGNMIKKWSGGSSLSSVLSQIN